MFRALLRLLSMVFLAVAVIMAVLDATRSIAANSIVATPLWASWATTSPTTLQSFEQSVSERLPPFVQDTVIDGILTLPGFAVFGALALLFYLAGRRPSRGENRFAVQR